MKYKFDCKACNHTFEKTINSVASGGWCGCKTHKTETKLFDWLSKNFNSVNKEKRFDWCKNITHLPFDFCIEELKLLIELDGKHHFIKIIHWKTNVEDAQNKDIFKMQKAIEHGYTIIRIYQPDVFEDKNNWETKLRQAIKKYNKPQVIYICQNNEYAAHIKKMNTLLLKAPQHKAITV